ncbi:MAG: MoaD/ThiS family protein [Gemmatimonadota bacterium]
MTTIGTDRMQLQVQLFGSYRDIAPGSSLSLEMPPGATVADLVRCLHDKVPGKLPPNLAVAVNRRHARAEQVLEPSDEVALIPAVAGG